MNRIETKSEISVDEAGQLTGIAWPFGSPDRAGDVITKGAFASARPPIPLLFGHRADDVVGVWTSIEETGAGLVVKGKLLVDDVERAKEVHAMVKAGALGGLSIGFRTRKATPRRPAGRTISDVELVEISLVTIPSHPGARVTAAKDAARTIDLAEAINRAAALIRSI